MIRDLNPRPFTRGVTSEARVPFELAAHLPMVVAPPRYGRSAPGLGRPVVIVPGFMQDDTSFSGLHWFLRRLGARTYRSGLGRNLGPTAGVLTALRETLETVAVSHGTRVTLIGTSLGGCFAREVARTHPSLVRQLILLAAPFRSDGRSRGPAMALWRAMSSAFDRDVVDLLLRDEDEKQPLAVPSTSIYSRTDGVVRWTDCLEAEDASHENIQVVSSHIGLAWHPAAQFAVGDRVCQPIDVWSPFRPPRHLRMLYPRFRRDGDEEPHADRASPSNAARKQRT